VEFYGHKNHDPLNPWLRNTEGKRSNPRERSHKVGKDSKKRPFSVQFDVDCLYIGLGIYLD
jgi:hypothetical protein